MNTDLRFLNGHRVLVRPSIWVSTKAPESTGALRGVKYAGHSGIWVPVATTQGLCPAVYAVLSLCLTLSYPGK